MHYLFYSRIRDNNKIQITIYERYNKFYKKKIIIINTFARLSYS